MGLHLDVCQIRCPLCGLKIDASPLKDTHFLDFLEMQEALLKLIEETPHECTQPSA